jgi:AAHS family 4-hydroxybenzoate transporter-like MFS transporter
VPHPTRWDELTRILRRLGHPVEAGRGFADPRETVSEGGAALRSLFSGGFLRDTLGLWLAFFASLNAVYLVFGWLPAMLSARGLDIAAASSGLAAYNFGGVLGVLLWASMVTVAGSRSPLLGGALAGGASALALQFVAVNSTGSHALLIAGIGLHGLFANAVQTTMYALAAHVYPTRVRATGVAFAASIGRLGAMLSSFTGAWLIQAGGAAYLNVLAVSMSVTCVGLAIVKTHFVRPDVRGGQ